MHLCFISRLIEVALWLSMREAAQDQDQDQGKNQDQATPPNIE